LRAETQRSRQEQCGDRDRARRCLGRGLFLDPTAPFGGFKNSGYGRDLGEEALLGNTQTKSVWVNLE
jgi:acyl-CoA reductase-like NAD-dependent aldehyde dehydrogenase